MARLFMDQDMEIYAIFAHGFLVWRASALIPICIGYT